MKMQSRISKFVLEMMVIVSLQIKFISRKMAYFSLFFFGVLFYIVQLIVLEL